MLNLKVFQNTASCGTFAVFDCLQNVHGLFGDHSKWLITINLWWQRWNCRRKSVLDANRHLPIISGVQARTASVDEPATLPRRRITSEGQYQNGSDDGSSPDVPVRSPIRCVSPEFVSAIALNPGGRPKEVDRAHIGTWFLTLSVLHWHVYVFVSAILLLSRDTCTATVRPLRRWMVAPSVRHPLLVVRCFPKPLPSPFRRKPLTSTCVSSHSGWQKVLWSSGKVIGNIQKKNVIWLRWIVTFVSSCIITNLHFIQQFRNIFLSEVHWRNYRLTCDGDLIRKALAVMQDCLQLFPS